MTSFASQTYAEILTSETDMDHILRKPTSIISIQDWNLVHPTVQKLLHVRNTILKGGAGLAAPQIGISLPLFVYTPDRTTENLKVVINPTIEPHGAPSIRGGEACYSVPLCCTFINRWQKIKVRFQDIEGRWIEEILDGFSAKVFQHEMDHLEGKLTLDHPSAEVICFTDPQLFESHMKQIHLEDAKHYKRDEGFKNPL